MVPGSQAETSYSPAAIRRAFGGCGSAHTVLAFQSLFAAFDPKPRGPSPPGWSVGEASEPGLTWLDQRVLPVLLAPSRALEGAADRIAAALTAADAVHAPRGRELACAHIRRGDFREECAQYDVERTRRDARPWVVWHHRHGWGCWQSESELALNLKAAQTAHSSTGGQPLAFFAAIEDASALAGMATLRPFNVTPLATLLDGVSGMLPLPPALAAILLDQLTCARARVLILNAYSTFSQLVMGRIGLRHPRSLGWVRDLTKAQQKSVGVSVAFWRYEEGVGRLVAAAH